jgi:glycosyltransferase involved in cell wall biosynthesis
MGEPISVILPIHRWHARSEPSIRSVLEQHYPNFELILVVNGQDEALESELDRVLTLDDRIRVLRTDSQGIASALNTGIRYANHALIARMDDDDLSFPDRFMLQERYLGAHPGLAGCGGGATLVDSLGIIKDVVLPPTSPEQTRWRILLWNPFVHGSMMLRKSAVLAAGGYDETLVRAQDYDLWIKLSEHGLGGIPDIVYQHTLGENQPIGLDGEQGRVTADRLLDMWSRLPEKQSSGLESAMKTLACSGLDGRLEIEHLMEQSGPTRALLMAWLWSCWRFPISRTDSPARLARLQAGEQVLSSEGIDEVWLWGGGDFARFILAHSETLGVRICGIVDDHRVDKAFDRFRIVHPETLSNSACVLIASDLYEDQIWERSASVRNRGVRVLRLPRAHDMVTNAADTGIAFTVEAVHAQ